MNNADMPAMPLSDPEMWMDSIDLSKGAIDALGLTKREHFAAMAMQGMLSSMYIADFAKDAQDIKSQGFLHSQSDAIAIASVHYADALLKALEQQEGEK